jgi:hypothetical protein
MKMNEHLPNPVTPASSGNPRSPIRLSTVDCSPNPATAVGLPWQSLHPPRIEQSGLWSCLEVRAQRQGEADPIIDFMNRWSLESLLTRGTKTWQNVTYATTIDLMLASQELASSVLKCKVHDSEHGSDHRAIETQFDVGVPDHAIQPRLLFKNAPWNAIRERIANALECRPACGDVQRQTDHLMQVVQEAVNTLTPKAKPSPYAKRWWTQDLTKLRQVYTYWRNRARVQRRGGETLPMLEQ